jgi:AAA family ATP:ADP antiporter
VNEAALHRALARVVAVRAGEARALLWSFCYFFCLLAGYYVLRPLRDEMGIAGGVRNLPWLFTATFFTMLAAVPVFGAVVAKLPRQRFIPLVYHFFVANIAIFWVMLTLGIARAEVARVFFVWISVFNLFAVSVFWSFMADLYGSEQGKRLYGFIAAGGSAGALVGPLATVAVVKAIGPVNLLIVAAALLELAVACVHRLEGAAPALKAGAAAPERPKPDSKGLGGGWLAGLAMVLRSPYLAGIALWVSLLSLAGTFLYLQQADIVKAASDDPAVRTRIFATIDLVVGVLQLIVQFLATGRLIARFGAGPAAAFLPLVFGAGFCALAGAPVLGVVIAFQAIQRTANFALSNPAREILFTVLDREEKYKAKSVIDMVVFRGVDSASSLLYGWMRGIGMEITTISLATVPVTGAWLALALWLGRAQERRARALAERSPP